MTIDTNTVLKRILAHGGAAKSGDCGGSDRKWDRAKRKAKRQGLIVFDGAYWRITDEGRKSLI